MLLKAILIGLIGVFGRLDSRLLGRLNFERPLITSTLVGIVLGDVKAGLMVGATLEAISIGLVAVGASSPPDMVLGGVIASSLTIMTNAQPETALTIAMPIAVLGQMMLIIMQTVYTGLAHTSDKFIEAGEFQKARYVPFFTGLIANSLIYFIPIFVSVYFGTGLISSIVDAIPEWLSQGLTVIGKVLPAFGFAMLLDMMMDNKNWMFMLAGFFVVAYAGLDITGLSILAVIIALILADIRFRKSGSNHGNTDTDENEELDELDLPDDE